MLKRERKLIFKLLLKHTLECPETMEVRLGSPLKLLARDSFGWASSHV